MGEEVLCRTNLVFPKGITAQKNTAGYHFREWICGFTTQLVAFKILSSLAPVGRLYLFIFL